MKHLALILFALTAWGQSPPTTTVADTIMLGIGSATYNGSIVITAPDRSYNSVPLVNDPVTVTVTAGVFSVALVPNDQTYPSTVYTATYYSKSGAKIKVEDWFVPTAASPLGLLSVVTRRSVVPPNFAKLALAQIAIGGAALTDCVGNDGTKAVWKPCGTGGGGGAIATVFGRVGTITPQAGDYTTSLVTEGSNQYFTPSRAIAAMGGLYVAPPASSVSDGALPLFDTTSGKLLKQLALSGVLKVTNGVPGVAAKGDLGLGNVDNTADTAKPVSTLQQAALDTKPTRTYGTAPPTSTPGAVGDIYTDTVARAAYTAFCTTSSACWGLPAATADVAQGAGVSLSGTTTKTIMLDDTVAMTYVVAACPPSGVGEVGVLAFCSNNDDIYRGNGSGWALVTGAGSATAGTTGQFYVTNDLGVVAWGGLSVGGGLNRTFSGATTTIGLDTTVIPTLASDNVWTGKRIATPTAVQTLSAGTAITAAQVAEVTAGSDITLTATPTIAAGSAGEFMTLINTSSSYKITLQDETHLTGTKLFLAASANYELKPRNTIQLMYSDTVGGWMQIGGGAAAACSARPIGSMYGNTIGSYYGVGIGTLYCI